MTTHWVIGAAGLVGSAVTRELARRGVPVHGGPRIHWGSEQADADLRAGLHGLIAVAGDDWRIVWCAGAAVTDSSAETFARERAAFDAFLADLGGWDDAVLGCGSIVFASSAGGAYGGSVSPPFTEQSVPAPLGDYGRSKLLQEAALERFAIERPVRVLIARIANVYGPGQDLAKSQGLISRMCLSVVTRVPLSVYVSLDTLRDYIYVDDCARMLLDAGDRLGVSERGSHMKIIGSGASTSIAGVIGELRRVAGARPLIVMGASRSASLQGRDLRLRSVRWTDLDAGPRTTLSAGIERTLEAVRASAVIASTPMV